MFRYLAMDGLFVRLQRRRQVLRRLDGIPGIQLCVVRLPGGSRCAGELVRLLKVGKGGTGRPGSAQLVSFGDERLNLGRVRRFAGGDGQIIVTTANAEMIPPVFMGVTIGMAEKHCQAESGIETIPFGPSSMFSASIGH